MKDKIIIDDFEYVKVKNETESEDCDWCEINNLSFCVSNDCTELGFYYKKVDHNNLKAKQTKQQLIDEIDCSNCKERLKDKILQNSTYKVSENKFYYIIQKDDFNKIFGGNE